MLPFAVEINHSGDVLFPWLCIRIVIIHILVVIIVFICESGKTMSEFVDYHRFELWVVGCRQSVTTVDASAAISVCVCEDYDVLIWKSRQAVIHLSES